MGTTIHGHKNIDSRFGDGVIFQRRAKIVDRESLNKLLSREPFEPFELHLSSGEIYTVRHPEMAVLGKSKIFVYDATSDMMDIVGLLCVAAVRTAQPA